MGEMSSIVSRRPSFLNQSNEAFWMSMRLGRSRTCVRREKLLRARGAATLVVNRYSLPYWRSGANWEKWTGGAGRTSARPRRVAKAAHAAQGMWTPLRARFEEY